MKPRADLQDPHPALPDSVIRSPPELHRNSKDHLEAGGSGWEREGWREGHRPR